MGYVHVNGHFSIYTQMVTCIGTGIGWQFAALCAYQVDDP